MARYDVREDYGMWSVIDADTGEVAKVNDPFLEGMDVQDADEAADVLNWLEEHLVAKPH